MSIEITAMPGRFPVSRDWRANWIWHHHAPSKNAWVLFRSEFDVNSVAGVSLFISADTRYRAFVNGSLIGDGPIQSQPYHQYYDERDISASLRPGVNCIAVVVNHQGIQASTRGGLLAEIVDGAGTRVCVTGSEWRATIGTAWKSNTNRNSMNKIGPYQEHVDLREMPAGWHTPGFDDAKWQEPLTILSRGGAYPLRTMPWCRMIPRDIDHLVTADAYPVAIHTVEECLDLAHRRDPGDLSTSLSQVGRPLDWAKIQDADDLLAEAGAATLACSDRHQDGVTDGRYDPCLTLDFGRVLTGYAELDVEAPAGALIEVGYAERLVDGTFNNAIECPFADRAIFAEGHNVFRPLIWRSFRYLRIRLKHCESELKLRAARAVEVNYPYERRGMFKGSERFERIFDICRTTVELCSIESLMDTPFREQAQWLGDVAAVTLPCIYACFGDARLPGKFLRQAAMNTKPTGMLANVSNVADTGWEGMIPDYSLWWVIALWEHYKYTGDARYIHECYPEMQRIMRTHLEFLNQDGLINGMIGWVFIDWAHVDTRGVCAPYNAIFAGACDAATQMASLKGDSWAENAYGSAARGVRKAFAATFLDSHMGVIVDAVVDGETSDRLSEHGNAAAIAFGCVDDDVADRIIEQVFDRCTVRTTEAQPFFMVVVLEALKKRGRRDLALKLMDDRWGKRMVDRGRTSCTEEWYENGSWRDGTWSGFERTHSHAWSACAAEFLVKKLAGIEVIGAGCSKLQVDPYKADFPYEIVYPTPKGDVSVKWDGAQVSVDAPDSIEIKRIGG